MQKARAWLDSNRLQEFPALKDSVYLDHAGTTLVSRRQLDGFRSAVLGGLHGNPHSHSASSQLTSDVIDQIRYRILQYFNTSPEDYSVVFTSGCTASLKIVAESFDYQGNRCHGNNGKPSVSDGGGRSECQIKQNKSYDGVTDTTDVDYSSGPSPGIGNQKQCLRGRKLPGNEKSAESDSEKSLCHDCCRSTKGVSGSFTYLVDNHTSVQGMRQIALSRAGQMNCVTCDCHGNDLESKVKVLYEHDHFQNGGNHLFAFPAQSNYSGWKYPLKWIEETQKGRMGWQRSCRGQCQGQVNGCCHGNGWYVLLDAAALVSTSRLDLEAVKPDFVTLSFYKMFGFPTGLGALLVRNDAGHVLKKTYYGGGTVEVSLPTQLFHVHRAAVTDRFEDGTVSFLDIIALRHGFDALEDLAGGIGAISLHTFHLAQYFYDNLTSCCHGNGSPLAEVYTYGDFQDADKQGAIVNFNLKRANGEYIGFATVDSMAQLHNVHVRTGCFCNIGACQHFLKMTDEQIKQNFEAGHVCGDNNDLIDGRPTGSIRVSFGYMSTLHDAQACLQFMVDCFLENTTPKPVFCERKTVTQSGIVDCFQENTISKPVFCERKTATQSGIEDCFQENTTPKPVFCERKTVIQSAGLVLEPKAEDIQQESEKDRTINKESGNERTIKVHSIKLERNVDLSKESSMSKEKVRTAGKGDSVQTAWEMGKSVIKEAKGKMEPSEEYSNCSGKHLAEICLYPVKSCGAFKVGRWGLGERGLLYDREWMVVTESGIAMSQKRERALCLVRPAIDTDRQTLALDFPGMEPIAVPLQVEEDTNREVKLCNSRVCGDRVQSVDCGDAVGAWLSEALKRPGCRLIRQKADDKRSANKKPAKNGDSTPGQEGGQLSLANVSQYLMISRDSVACLHSRIHSLAENQAEMESQSREATPELLDVDNLVDRFRANLVISGYEGLEEDSWQSVQIGNVRFTCDGPCTRCQMICMDQRTAQKSTEPLRTLQLWKERKNTFGIHMSTDRDWARPNMEIRVGDPVFPDVKEASQ